MKTIVGHLEIVDRKWWHIMLGSFLHAAFMAGCWWIWVWGFKLDAPSWAYYFAAFCGIFTPIPKFFLRRRG